MPRSFVITARHHGTARKLTPCRDSGHGTENARFQPWPWHEGAYHGTEGGSPRHGPRHEGYPLRFYGTPSLGRTILGYHKPTTRTEIEPLCASFCLVARRAKQHFRELNTRSQSFIHNALEPHKRQLIRVDSEKVARQVVSL